MKLSRKERGRILKANLDELARNVVEDKEKLESFVQNWTKGFYNYSMNNMLLIKSQKPEATLVAGYKQWTEKYNRKVNRGEKAIWIIAPRVWKKKKENENGEKEEITRIYFNPIPVFDISQTSGEPVEVGNPHMVTGDTKLEDFTKISKCEVKIEDRGLSNGATDGKTIWLTPKENEASMVATFIHEEAHVRLKHTENETKTSDVKEIEAEAVSYIVTKYFGLKNRKSKYYIGNWAEDKKKLEIDAPKILSVAESIIKDVEGFERENKA